MSTSIRGKKVAFLATDGVEEVEYTEPRKAVENADGTLVTSRKPDDLPAFCDALLEQISA